jgi:hypothetical protein
VSIDGFKGRRALVDGLIAAQGPFISRLVIRRLVVARVNGQDRLTG